MKKSLIFALMALGSLVAQPADRRVEGRTRFFAEIPLATTYACGNMWTGWAGRWTEALLMVNREAGFPPDIYYRVTPQSLITTLQEMRDYGLDGSVYNCDRPYLVDRIWEAEPYGGLPGLFVPSLQLRRLVPTDRDWHRAIETFPKNLKSPKGWYVKGKPVFVSWWEDRFYTPDGDFISGDGYWDENFNRHWKMVRLADNKVKDIGTFFIPEVYRDVYCRCDLHPRWRPDGKQIGFNSVHEGSRQVYVMDVKGK